MPSAALELGLQVLYPRRCGPDIHKKFVVACPQGREEVGGTALRLEQGYAYARHARQGEGLFPALPLLQG